MSLVPHLPATDAQDHAGLIVALDAGDLAGVDLARAERLATSCAGCASLVEDLAAIRGAMDAIPIPPRRRDYRLTAEDAARLRPSPLRRLVGWLASPRSTVRPLATGLATLGIVGLLLTAGLPGLTGGSTAMPIVGAPVESAGATGGPSDRFMGTYAPAAVPNPLPGEPNVGGVAGDTGSPGPSDERNATAAAPEDAPVEPPGDAAGEKVATAAGSSDAGVPVALVASVGLLGAGLALFVARALARRRPA